MTRLRTWIGDCRGTKSWRNNPGVIALNCRRNRRCALTR